MLTSDDLLGGLPDGLRLLVRGFFGLVFGFPLVLAFVLGLFIDTKDKPRAAACVARIFPLSPFHPEPWARVVRTVSLGVAEARAEDGSIVELLKRADRALYRAKEQGRDRVVAAA